MKLLKRSLVLLGCALAAAAAFTACELSLGGDDRLTTSKGPGTGGGADGTPFIEATFTAQWTGTPTFYLMQQLGSISVTDSEGKDTNKEYTGTAWWDGKVNTTSLTLENGKSITWNVTVTSDTFGLVLEGVKDEQYLDLNLNYAVATDAWGAGTWNVKSYDASAYGIKGHTYVIKVSADAAGSVYTVSVTDKDGTPAAGGDDAPPAEEIPSVDPEDWDTSDDAISYTGTIKNSLIPAFDVEDGGFTVEFKATIPAGTSDWGSQVLSYKGFHVTIPNLDPFNNTVDEADDLKGINAFPGTTGSSLENDLTYNSAFDGVEHTIKLVFTEDSITYYLDETEWVEYTSSVWEGKISDFIGYYVEGLRAGEVVFNAASLEIKDVKISKE